MSTPNPVSVGQLCAMTAHTRTATIAALSADVRRKLLAHLASLGAREAAKQVRTHLDNGNSSWAASSLAYVAMHADVAAELTADPEEL